MTGRRVHCSYHKCLTVYFQRVMREVFGRDNYRHFNSDLGVFERDGHQFAVSSVNNHAIDLESLGNDARVTRFIRDPRDLIVSGYHYHRRGSEKWTTIVDPTPDDLMIVNGTLPSALRPGESYTDCLLRLDVTQGLIAEAEFRATHYGAGRRERRHGRRAAEKFSASSTDARKQHIRDPSAGQWRRDFTDEAEQWVNDRYGDVIVAAGY